ncbi:unnamed protein product [Linum trigynum]|uniref:Uncharacterized protein n=1 Tax=Linum trigynum TaxID=586398 RepID=A0AAV2DFD3_9ROSI
MKLLTAGAPILDLVGSLSLSLDLGISKSSNSGTTFLPLRHSSFLSTFRSKKSSPAFQSLENSNPREYFEVYPD